MSDSKYASTGLYDLGRARKKEQLSVVLLVGQRQGAVGLSRWVEAGQYPGYDQNDSGL